MALQVGELYASFGIDTSGVDKALANIESKFTNLGKNLAITGGAMTLAITKPLMNIGKDIYKTGTEFGEAMSRVFATADLDKSIKAEKQAMDDLTAKALEMGSTTKFTSSEAAEALNYMAMAGWKTDDMLAGLAPIMNLAAASGEELGLVSDIVTDALTAFGKDADYAQDFVDILAKTASNANTNVAMLGESFKYAAPMAGTMGYSVQDIAVALGIMANSGIKASQAGTTLRTMFTRMTGTDEKVINTMKALNIEMTNADGSMRPLNEVLTDLRASFAGLTEEQQVQYATTLAGRNAVSGFMALINASEKDFNDLTNAINDSSGAAERMSKVALDNAAGDLVYLTSAIDGAKVALWGLAEGPFRELVQKATQYVTAFNQMDDATKLGVLRTGAYAAAVGPATAALGGLAAILPKVASGFKYMFSWQGAVVLGLAALGAAAIDTDNSIGTTFENMSKVVGEKAGEIADYVATHSAELAANAGKFLDSIKTGIASALPNILQAGADILIAIFDGVALNVSKAFEIGRTILTLIKGAVVANAGRMADASLQLIRNLLVGMIENIPILLQEGGEIAIAIGEALLNANWKETGEGIWTAIQNALTASKDTLQNLGNIIKEKFGVDDWTGVAIKIWNGLSSGIMQLSGFASITAIKILKSISSSSIWTNAGPFLANVASAIVTGIGDMIPGMFQNVEGVLNAGVELGNKILEGVNTAIAAMKENDLAGKLGDVAGKIITGIFSTTKNLTGNKDVETFVSNLGTAIIGSIGLLGDIAGAILTGLADPKAWADAGSAAADIAGFLVDAITKAIPALFENVEGIAKAGIELGNAILGGLAQALGDMERADLGTKLGKGASAILDGLLTSIKDIGNSTQMETFMSNLSAGFSSAMGLLGDVAGEIVSYILSPEGIGAIFEAGKTIVKVLGQGLTAAVMGIGTFVGNFIDKLLAGLGLQDPAVLEEFKQSGTLLTAQIQAGMEEGTEKGSAQFTKTAMLAAIAMRSGIDTAFLDNTIVGDIASQWADSFNAGDAKKSVEELKKQFQWFWDDESQDWIDFDFSGISDEMWNAIYEAVSSGDWKSLRDYVNIGAEDLLGDPAEGVDEWVQQKEAVIAETSKELKKTSAASLNDAVGEGAKSMTQTVLNEKGPMSEAAKTVADAEVREFVTTMSAEQGAEIANTFLNAMYSAMDAGGVNLTRLAYSTASNVYNAYVGTMNSSTGFSIGNNFAAGMQNGIRSGIDGIVSAARESGEAAVQALRDAIQEGSPSKLTKQSGIYFAAGFEDGIERSISSVEKVVSNMGESAVNALDLASRGYGTASHARVTTTTTAKKVETPVKDMIKAAAKTTKAAENLTNQVAEQTSYAAKNTSYASSGGAASYAASGVSGGTSGGSMGMSGTDLGALIETYARLVATALDGVTVELNGDEVGSLVAPVVSATIAQNALARSNGTV